MVRGRRTRAIVRRAKRMTIPIAVVAGFIPGILDPINFWRDQGSQAAAREMARIWTGYDYSDGSFDFGRMKWGLLPALMGGIVHWVASKIGINRALARSGIPFLRV